MTSENYVENVIKTDCVYDTKLAVRLVESARMLHAAMGLVTEAAELLDMLKKHIYYGKKLDMVNAKEEIGDSSWYIGLAVDEMKTTMNEVLTLNIEKLKLRYPGKFNSEDAINRDVAAERVLLEKDSWKKYQTTDGPVRNPVLHADSIKAQYKGIRTKEWLEFAIEVANHIENYTIPQYGDKGKDQASEWSIEHCLEESKKYGNRYGKNQREGQDALGFLKSAHYQQMAATKFKELAVELERVKNERF